MKNEELFEIVNEWFNTGSLSDNLKPEIQRVYTEITGDFGERCRTCPSYWNDVLVQLQIHLKGFGYKVMDLKNQKYIISKEAAFLQVHGKSFVYINKGTGPESESAKYLTDKIAEELLAENPDRAEVIILNPDYKGPEEKQSGSAKSTTSKESTGSAPAKRLTAAEKKAQKEAEEAAKLTESKATEAAKAAETKSNEGNESAPDADQDEDNDPEGGDDSQTNE